MFRLDGLGGLGADDLATARGVPIRPMTVVCLPVTQVLWIAFAGLVTLALARLGQATAAHAAVVVTGGFRAPLQTRSRTLAKVCLAAPLQTTGRRTCQATVRMLKQRRH